MLALPNPVRTFAYLVVPEFIHHGIGHLTLDNTGAPRIDDTCHLPIPGDVLAVVPGVPLLISALRHRHAADLQRRGHATLGVLHATREDLLSHDACEVFANDARRDAL